MERHLIATVNSDDNRLQEYSSSVLPMLFCPPAKQKSGRAVGDVEPVVSEAARTLPVWKTAAVLLVRSCKAGYAM